MFDQMKMMTALMQDTEFRSFLTHPKVQEAFRDPEVQKVVRSRDMIKVMTHPKILSLMQDPDLAPLMLKIKSKLKF